MVRREWGQILKTPTVRPSPRGEIEDLVTGLYLGFLGRYPDPAGLRSKSDSIEELGFREGARFVVDTFFRSEEFRTKLRTHWSYSELVEPTQDLNRLYKDVVSLGSHCLTSAILKAYGLKVFSSPFDWVFSSLPMIAHCLSDDFATFLDRKFYDPSGSGIPGGGRCQHSYYQNNFGIEWVFNHSDPTRGAAYAYLTRCVDRFRTVLASREWKMFIAITYDAPDIEENFLKLRDDLRRLTQAFRLLVVAVYTPEEDNPDFSIQRLSHTEDSTLLRFSSRSEMGPTGFANQEDDHLMANLIRSYRFDLATPNMAR